MKRSSPWDLPCGLPTWMSTRRAEETALVLVVERRTREKDLTPMVLIEVSKPGVCATREIKNIF